MHTTIPDEKRLEILNQAQPERPWKSCDEKRRCLGCDGVFRGDSVVVRRSRTAGLRLACPNCAGGPSLWVRLGNPLTDEKIWAEWDAAIDLASREFENSDEDLAAAS